MVKRLHSDGVVGTYDDAVVGKDEEDNVQVHLHEKPTQYGAWTGLVVGIFVGILFAPSMLVANLAGAAAGDLIGHLWRGKSRSDMKELGEALDGGRPRWWSSVRTSSRRC